MHWLLASNFQLHQVCAVAVGSKWKCHSLRQQAIGVVNTLRSRQNGCHFADDNFGCIFLNENVWIAIKTWLNFVPKGPINNIPALVQIMAWCRPGDKPLSEPMVVRLPTHICITRNQWVNCWTHWGRVTHIYISKLTIIVSPVTSFTK